MKTLWLFYIGAGIDIIALIAAAWMMLSDMLKGYSGTNNPLMLSLTLIVAAFVVAGFWQKGIGNIKLGTTLIWIPGTPLMLYVLFVLLFVIFRPDFR